jgi:Mn2+/Fe2+ NRAMP family transporter
MFADNDFGGMDTYLKAGYEHGYMSLFVILISLPILYVNQDMVVRLGTITRMGHAQLIKRHFSKMWMLFTVADMSIANAVTMMSNIAGLILIIKYFGWNVYFCVPVIMLCVALVSLTGRFSIWERAMFLLIAVNFLFIPIAIALSGAAADSFLSATSSNKTFDNSFVYLSLGILGTTIAPWQLFFQQASIVDKGLTKKHLFIERIDTFVGVIMVGLIAVLLMAIGHMTQANSESHTYSGISSVVNFLSSSYSSYIHQFFLILLLNSSLLGICVITVTSAYGINEMLERKGGLSKSFKEAPVFYTIVLSFLAICTIIMLFIKTDLNQLVFYAQVLAGILLPIATLTLLVLCNERSLLGEKVNGTLMNFFAGIFVFLLISISLYLNMSLLLHINISPMLFFIDSLIFSTLLGAMTSFYYNRFHKMKSLDAERKDKGKFVALIFLRCYTLFSLIILLISFLE